MEVILTRVYSANIGCKGCIFHRRVYGCILSGEEIARDLPCHDEDGKDYIWNIKRKE